MVFESWSFTGMLPSYTQKRGHNILPRNGQHQNVPTQPLQKRGRRGKTQMIQQSILARNNSCFPEESLRIQTMTQRGSRAF